MKCFVANCFCYCNPRNMDVSFFKFPGNEDKILHLKWIKALGGGSPKKFDKVCQLHFKSSDIRSHNRKKTLCRDAVPSVFGEWEFMRTFANAMPEAIDHPLNVDVNNPCGLENKTDNHVDSETATEQIVYNNREDISGDCSLDDLLPDNDSYTNDANDNCDFDDMLTDCDNDIKDIQVNYVFNQINVENDHDIEAKTDVVSYEISPKSEDITIHENIPIDDTQENVNSEFDTASDNYKLHYFQNDTYGYYVEFPATSTDIPNELIQQPNNEDVTLEFAMSDESDDVTNIFEKAKVLRKTVKHKNIKIRTLEQEVCKLTKLLNKYSEIDTDLLS